MVHTTSELSGSNGLQRCIVAQVAGAILGEQARVQNPEKDESALNSGLRGIGSGNFGPICVVVRVTTAGMKRIVGAQRMAPR